MATLTRCPISQFGLLLVLAVPAGCGGSGETSGGGEATDTERVGSAAEATAADVPSEPASNFAPVVLGGAAPSNSDEAAGNAPLSGGERRQEILDAMMPLQVMLGSWRGITQRQVGDFKGVDEPQWVWDFQTDRNQPAMVMTSEGGAWFRELRLTYLADSDKFRMTARGPEDEQRTFDGQFSEEPVEVPGDDSRPHLTYKLMLTQLDADETDDRLQVIFNQQENNRYLLEVYRQRGESFRRVDTVSTQREGTSIAASDEDYGERKCVISGGLGTIQVSYNGRTFWVCCTGCQAAFEEDPETWIAEFDAANQ